MPRPITVPRKGKRASRRSTPAAERRPSPPPIELPSPTDPRPTNFLRNQQALLGHAGLVSGVHPANLSLQRHMRGRTPQNPIIVEEEEERPSIGRRPLQTQAQTTSARLPVPSSHEILSNLVKQKNLIPVMDALVRLVAGSAVPLPPPPPPPGSCSTTNPSASASTSQVPPPSTPTAPPQQPYAYPYYPYPYAYPYYYGYPYGYTYPYAASAFQRPAAPYTSDNAPQAKRRKLAHVPAGAGDWDVPYPFPEGQGPPGYHENWQRQRGQQLVEDLVGLVKSAAKKAALQKAQGESSASGPPVIGSVEYYRERVLRHYRPHTRYEGQPTTLHPVQPPPMASLMPDPTPPPSRAAGMQVPVSIGPTSTVPTTPIASPSAAGHEHALQTSKPDAPPASPAPPTTEVVDLTVDEAQDSYASAVAAPQVVDDVFTTDPLPADTDNNIDDLLAIFNDLPAGDLDALISSTDFSSINADDFDFSMFDMTGTPPSSDSQSAAGTSTEPTAKTEQTAAEPIVDFDFDMSAPTTDPAFPIDPELLALPHPGPPPTAAPSTEPDARPEKPTVQTTNAITTGLGSGTPPTPTLVGSPLSQVDFDPPTPDWNFAFPEPEIAGSGSEPKSGSEAGGEAGALIPRHDLRRYVLTKTSGVLDGTVGEGLPRRQDKGKGRAVEVEGVAIERGDTPMSVDQVEQSSTGTTPMQFVVPDAPPLAPLPSAPQPAAGLVPPSHPFDPMDMLEPLRKTLEALFPPQPPTRVSSLLVSPPVVPPKTTTSQVKDREDILRRARVMRGQLLAEIERAKIELWETAMEGGCLAVLGKEREKMFGGGEKSA